MKTIVREKNFKKAFKNFQFTGEISVHVCMFFENSKIDKVFSKDSIYNTSIILKWTLTLYLLSELNQIFIVLFNHNK